MHMYPEHHDALNPLAGLSIGWDTGSSINDIEPTVPEFWLMALLAEMEENRVMLPLVNTQFSTGARLGVPMNIQVPRDLAVTRRSQGDAITLQPLLYDNVVVRLDQQLDTSIVVYDEDLHRSNMPIISQQIGKMAETFSEAIEAMLIGMQYDYYLQAVGAFGSAVTDDTLLDLNSIFRRRAMPQQGRNLVIGAGMERDVLDVERFVEADKSNDAMGQPIRTGRIGYARGFDIHVSNFASELIPMDPEKTAELTADFAAKESGPLTVDTLSAGGTIPVGTWVTVEGDDRPLLVTAKTDSGGGDITSITVAPALSANVLTNATVTFHQNGDVQANYEDGYGKFIDISGFSQPLQVGQGLTFAGHTNAYAVIAVDPLDTDKVMLNRALTADLASGTKAFAMPVGDFGFAFHREAITFLSGALEAPPAGTGVTTAVGNSGGVGMRVMMGYDIHTKKRVISADMLVGTHTLDKRYGALVVK